VTLVRVIAIVLVLCPPSVGLIAYIVAWIVMPNDPLVFPAHPETVNSRA
jgi:phage shock protein PspC (stress-responsive transcriptional regulator)